MSIDVLLQLRDSLLETLYMVAAAWLIGGAIGVPLGVFLATSGKGELFAAPRLNALLNLVVNATGSTPFIILVVALIPVTRFIVGTSIGTSAAIVPLTVAGAPFIARTVEAAIREVDHGLIEASAAMGATPGQIVRKVLLPEALSGITLGLTLIAVTLIAYSAMVGAVGGGGLGDLGIRYGYQRFRVDVMALVIVVLIALVQGVQMAGASIARRVNKRLRPPSSAATHK
jgi:D-methionine transport system permease protein